jgi:deoxyribodipyrimidine photo-lyase
LPELRAVPLTYLSNPSLMPEDLQHSIGVRIGVDYPAPIVDHESEAKSARAKISEIRKLPETKVQTKIILEKHGSRKRPPQRRKRKHDERQKSLFGEEE